jgi:hypothetical protein
MTSGSSTFLLTVPSSSQNHSGNLWTVNPAVLKADGDGLGCKAFVEEEDTFLTPLFDVEMWQTPGVLRKVFGS